MNKNKRNIKKKLVFSSIIACLLLLIVFSMPSATAATEIDLSWTGTPIYTEIGGAYWVHFPSPNASGTGVFDTYLAVKAPGGSDIEQGLNHNGAVDYDEDNSKTFALPLNKVPIVDYDGKSYREFVVDINQNKPSPLISLEKFQIWITNDSDLHGDYNIVTNTFNDPLKAKLIYDIDDLPSVNRTIILDYLVNSGSGKADYKVLVLASLFDTSYTYVTMFVSHGELHASNDGFEEWGVKPVSPRGSIELTKNVVWNGVTPVEGQKFQICITGPSFPTPNCQNFTYPGDLTKSWTDLIPGEYTISETDPGNMWTVIIQDGTTNKVTIPAEGGEVCASVTNIRKLGCLEVTKVVNWNGITPVAGTQFTICIQGPTYPTTPNCKTFTYPSDLVKTWCNLIPGDYTITEPGTDSSWTVTLPASPSSVPTNGGKAYATVTNTKKLGCLNITKVVCLGLLKLDGTTITDDFTIQISGPSGTFSQNFHYDGTQVSPAVWQKCDLIPGSYTITETGTGVNWTWSVSGDTSATVPPGGYGEGAVSNFFVSGCLNVTKVVCLGGLNLDGATITDDFTIQISGPSGTFSQNFHYNGTQVSPAVWQTCDLIPGLYTITETGTGVNWTWSVSGDTSATVPADGYGEATVTNTIEPGCIEVTKIIDWNGITENKPSVEFDITITGPSHPTGYTRTFTTGETAYDCDLIPGWYYVNETDPGANWTVTNMTNYIYVGPGGTCGSECTSVEIINTFQPGCLDVTKIVDWIGAAPDTNKKFNITVIGTGGPYYLEFDYDGGTINIPNLIPGSYDVYEIDPGNEWIWDQTTHTVIVEPGTPCNCTTFTNTLKHGCLNVTKIVDWIGAAPDTNKKFNITVIGTGGPYYLEFNYDGGTINIPNLVPGSYDVYEIDPGNEWIWDHTTHTVIVWPGQCCCASTTFTNTLKPGCIEVTKIIDWGEIEPKAVSFWICIKGPSHPTGYCREFTIGETAKCDNLIPGGYWVNESDPGTEWIVTNRTNYVIVQPGNCTCAQVEIINTHVQLGCTYTQGYWKTHADPTKKQYDDTWDIIGPGTTFFSTGMSYLEILQSPPKGGNAYLILAHQYIAAVLNGLKEDGNPPLPGPISDAITEVEGILAGSMNIPKGSEARARAIYLAGYLGDFNEGRYPGWCHECQCMIEY